MEQINIFRRLQARIITINNLVQAYIKRNKNNKLINQDQLISINCEKQKNLLSSIKQREMEYKLNHQLQIFNLLDKVHSKKLNENIKNSLIVQILQVGISKKITKITLITLNFLINFFLELELYSRQRLKIFLINEWKSAINKMTRDIIDKKYQLWLNQMGNRFLKQYNFQRSLLCFKLIQNINPNDVQSMKNIFIIYKLTHKTEQGIQYFQKLIKHQPTVFYPYMGLGLLAKNYPTVIVQCESIFNYQSLDKSADLGVNFNLCLYYQIVEDYGKMEKYFLKCLKIKDKLQKKQINFAKYFINQYDNIYHYLKSDIPDLINRILILVGILSKQLSYRQTAKQCYTHIMQDYKSNKLFNGFIHLFQKQFKYYSLRIQSIFSQFLLSYMFYVDKIEAIECFLKFYNLHSAGDFPFYLQFWHLIDKDRQNQINFIDLNAQILQKILKKEKISQMNEEESNLVKNVNLIQNIEIEIQKLDKMFQDNLKDQKNVCQISIKIMVLLKICTSNIIHWRVIPSKLFCFYQIYRQIQKEEQQIYQKIMKLQKECLQKNYIHFSCVIKQVKIFLLAIYPINELIKFIYNCLAYHLFENQLMSIKLYQILKQIKRSKNYNFTFLKAKLKDIFFQSSQTTTISTNSIKKLKCMSQQNQSLIKERNNNLLYLIKKHQQKQYRRNLSLPIKKKLQLGNNIKLNCKQDKEKLSQKEYFCNYSSLQQQQQKLADMLSQVSQIQKQNPYIYKFKFTVNDIKFNNFTNRKWYYNLELLLFNHIFHIYKLTAQTKTQYIFQQSYDPKLMIKTIDEYSRQNIYFFQYQVPRGDTILTYDYSILSKDREPKILWAFQRKHLFSFMRSVAGSINQLNKHGIYHKNITFRNFIKIGLQFKFVGLDEAIFIPRQQIQIKNINLSKRSFCLLKYLGQLQEQLAQQVYELIDYFLGFNYQRCKEESQWITDNQSSIKLSQNSYSELPQIDDIPKYILGEQNSKMIKRLIAIKRNKKFQSRQNKIKKCITLLKDNYQRIHSQQLFKIIQLLLKDQAYNKDNNREKINQEEIAIILEYADSVKNNKISICNFIQLLNHIEGYSQNYIQSFYQNEISPHKIQLLSNFIEFASLAQIREISLFEKNTLQSLIKQTPSLIYTYQSSLKNLLASLEYRIRLDKKIAEYFPYIPRFIESLHNLVGSENNQSIFTTQSRRNRLYKQFLKDQQYKRQNPNSFSTFPNDRGQSIQVSQLIRVSKQFTDKEQSFFEQQIQQRKEKAYPERRQNRMNFQQNLDADEMMKLDCLGCTTFMYEGFNIKDNGITKTDAVCFPSVHKISEEHHAIKRSIGALINSGGGVILFGCCQEYLSIIAKGQTIEESDQQRIAQQISQYLRCFEPKLNLYANSQLRFVPIVKNPYDNRIQIHNQKQQKKKREYIEGRYVTVLRLWPSQMSQVVFYSCNNEMLLYKRWKGQTIQIEGRQIIKQIKRKFQKYYFTEMLDTPSHCFEDHVCLKPQRGMPIKKQQKQEIQKNKDASTAVKAYTQEVKYNYASVVFLFQNSYQNVKRHLIDNNIRNFEFLEQQNTFERVILLLHDTSPKKMKEVVERYPVSKGKKTVLMLNITNSLKLNRNMNKDEFKSTLLYLRKKKSTEFLKLYEYKQGYYLETGSKVSFYYLFCHLRLHNFNNIKLVNAEISKNNDSRLLVTSQAINL